MKNVSLKVMTILASICLVAFACSDNGGNFQPADTPEIFDGENEGIDISEGDIDGDLDISENDEMDLLDEDTADDDILENEEENVTDADEYEEEEIDESFEDCLPQSSVILTPASEERAGSCTQSMPVEWFSFPAKWSVQFSSNSRDYISIGENYRYCLKGDLSVLCTIGEARKLMQLVFPIDNPHYLDEAAFKPGTDEFWFVTEDNLLGYWDLSDGSLYWVEPEEHLPESMTMEWEAIGFEANADTTLPILFGTFAAWIKEGDSWRRKVYPSIEPDMADYEKLYRQRDGRIVLTIFDMSDFSRPINYLRWDEEEQDFSLIVALPQSNHEVTFKSPTLYQDKMEIIENIDSENASNIRTYSFAGDLLNTEPIPFSHTTYIFSYYPFEDSRIFATPESLWREDENGHWDNVEIPPSLGPIAFSPDGVFFIGNNNPVAVQRLEDFETWEVLFPPPGNAKTRVSTYVSSDGAIWALENGKELIRSHDGCQWESVSCRPFGEISNLQGLTAIGGWSTSDILATATGEDTVWRLQDGSWSKLFQIDFGSSVTTLSTAGNDFVGMATDYWAPEYYTWTAGQCEWHRFDDLPYSLTREVTARDNGDLFIIAGEHTTLLLSEGQLFSSFEALGLSPLWCWDIDVVGSFTYLSCSDEIIKIDEENTVLERLPISIAEDALEDVVYGDSGPVSALDTAGCFWLFNEEELVETGYCFPDTDRLLRVADDEYIASGPSGSFVRFLVR